MKTFFYRFKTGLYTAVQSFSLAWSHKELFAYALCASGFSFLVTVVLYNMLNISYPDEISVKHLLKEALCAINPSCSQELGNTVILALASFIVLSITNFFWVAMFHHAGHILAGEKQSFFESIKKIVTKIPLILAWAGIALGIEQSAIMASGFSSKALSFFALLLFIGIHFATFFILPLIAYTNGNLKEIIILSFTVAKNRLVEVLGGGTWFAIIAGLFFVPMALFWGYWHMTDISAPWFKNGFVLLAALCAQLGIRIFIGTSFALFKGLIYSDYHRKNPTLEELYKFPWPQM
jgi:hypothetical protein